MHCRDPEDKPANCPIGIGRAIMANRISYCLNIKGPSITLDTACSGSLVGIDLACRSIHSGEVNTAIVAASNLYLTPEHVMDIGTVGHAHSPTALCHTFDASADGYVKAEAVSCVILKRLSDAIRDRDPVRAIIRGSASTRYVCTLCPAAKRELGITRILIVMGVRMGSPVRIGRLRPPLSASHILMQESQV